VFTFIVEFLAVILFAGCVWHATRFEGRAFVEQWFLSGFLYFIIRETINQVVLQMYVYAPAILRIGAAPALIGFLWISVFYLAYQFARRFTRSTQYAPVAGLMFLIASSLGLAIEATAAQLRWWVNPDARWKIFGGVPVAAPIMWGIAAVIFYLIFWRVAKSRLPDRGKTYAMITLSPVIAVADLLLGLLANAILG
jgi:hypothetical protein